MKSLSTYALLLLLFFSTSTVFSNTVSESLNNLKKFSPSDIEVTKNKTQKQVGQKTQEMLSKISESVELIKEDGKNASPELFYEIIRVSAMTLKVDPSEAAAEIILPIYEKHKKAFEKAFEQLPKKDRDSFKESLKNAAREESEGNG